ncbi:MAG: GNAT family N-acetyltransferase [Pseudomarimonas sp.]
MNAPAPEWNIVRREDASRFECEQQGMLCVIDYRIEGKSLLLPSVRVPQALEGRGIAGALTRAALDWARAQEFTVVPICPYVAAWLRRHPDYNDLLAATPAVRSAGGVNH